MDRDMSHQLRLFDRLVYFVYNLDYIDYEVVPVDHKYMI